MIELSGVAPGNKLRLVGGITAEVLEIVNDEWAKVRLIEVPDGDGRARRTLPRHRHHRSRLMLRVGFLPSDFNPMVLMLGEAEDLRLLAGVLRRFAREQTDVRLDELGFCTAPRTALTVTASPAPRHPAHRRQQLRLAARRGAGGRIRRSDRPARGAVARRRIGDPGMHHRGGNPGQGLARRIHRRLPALMPPHPPSRLPSSRVQPCGSGAVPYWMPTIVSYSFCVSAPVLPPPIT